MFFGAFGILILGMLGTGALHRAYGLLDNAYENWLNKTTGLDKEVVIMPDGDFSQIVGYLIGVGMVGIAIYGVLMEVFLCE
jgi:hypothetical protein